MTLAERIRQARKERGWTQEQLGEAVGVHLNTVVRWEGGIRIPSATKLKEIAGALGLDVATLLGDEPPASPHDVTPTRPQKEPPRLTYWAEVVEEARSAVRRGDRDELIDIRTLLERALTAVEDGCLAMGINAKRLPTAAGGERPQGAYGNAV